MTTTIIETGTKNNLTELRAYCYNGIEALIQFIKDNKSLIESSIGANELYIDVRNIPLTKAIVLHMYGAWHMAIDPSYYEQIIRDLPWLKPLITV